MNETLETTFVNPNPIDDVEKLYSYEIWISGKNGFSQYFATDNELDDFDESEICQFAIKHNIVSVFDVKNDLGYARNVDDDKEKVKFALENIVRERSNC